VLAEWPLSGTGRYRLALETAEEREELEVTVEPEKISPTAYASLISELQSSLPASVAVGLQRLGALAGLQLRPPGETTLAQELARLRRATLGDSSYAGLATTLTAIARDPHRVLRKNEVWVNSERARRLEPAGLLAAIQRPDNVDLERRRPKRVPDVRVEHSVDVYENRLLRSYHDQVASRLRRLAAAFAAQKLLASLLEVEQLLELLARGRREAQFLDAVSPLQQPPSRVTMVLLKRPEYRALLAGYLGFRRSAFVELDEPTLEAPLENLPHLYELWGTLHTIQALLHVGAELGYTSRAQNLARHADGGIYINILPGGHPAVVLEHESSGTIARLVPQRRFTRKGRPAHSVSFKQIPDITIEVCAPTGATSLFLFDPKYKLQSEEQAEPGDGRPKKIDIDTMHAYRDAIRNSDGKRIVRYAAILYPGPQTRYGNSIEALSARPLEPEALEKQLRAIIRKALTSPDLAS
jgi:predicted component of viral defense system (DUF524 family)